MMVINSYKFDTVVNAVGHEASVSQIREFNSQSWLGPSYVFQYFLGPINLGVVSVDLVINITLQGSSFSMCSHKPVAIYRDKRKFEYIYTYTHIYIYICIYTSSSTQTHTHIYM